MYKLKYSKYNNKLKQIGSSSYTPQEDKILDILERCVENGFVNEIKKYLNLNKKFRVYIPIWDYPSIANKSLLFAIKQDDMVRCRFLVERCKANVNFYYTAYAVYTSPLSMAVDLNKLHIIRYLLEHGADVNVNYKNVPYLHYPFRHPDIFRYLVEYGNNVNVNIRDINNATPLMKRCLFNHNNNRLLSELNNIRLLLARGVDVNSVDNLGKTALIYTVQSYSTDTIERINILLEAGANINIRDRDGITVLQYIRNRISNKGYMDEYDNQLQQHLISRGAQ